MTQPDKSQCLSCKDETTCKIHKEICNGYMLDCPDYEARQKPAKNGRRW